MVPHRAPVGDTYRKKSPFSGLMDHMGKVKECVSVLRDGVLKYIDGDFENFHKVAERVSRLEHEADLIKGNIGVIFPPRC